MKSVKLVLWANLLRSYGIVIVTNLYFLIIIPNLFRRVLKLKEFRNPFLFSIAFNEVKSSKFLFFHISFTIMH